MSIVRCPKCRELMQPREISGHYGARFSLFQCPECSGLWLDKDIAFAISRDSAVEVESDVEFEEVSTVPREAPLYCPRCTVYLMEQSGNGLPKGLHVDYCTTCHGFWFDKGELMIYKSYLEEKKKRSRKRLGDSEAARSREKQRRERIREQGRTGDISLHVPYSGMAAARLLSRVLGFLG